MSYTLIIPAVVLIVIVWLFRNFWTQNIKKAQELKKILEVTTNRIKELKDSNLSETEKQEEMNGIFEGTEWGALWSEFAETLHDQKEVDEDGIMRTVRVRATVPSQYFFSDSVVIDSAIKTEIYKHFPGMFTACGIIGTFFGLIWGLYSFDSSDLMRIQQGVSELLGAVRDAFIASFVAIFLSVWAIWLERKWYKECTDCLGRMTAAIDALYDAGLENEYLESIARSSEENANQSKQLKDGLVSELKPLLQNLVDNQIRELKPMLENMVQAQAETSKNQNAATDRLITHLSEMAKIITAGYREENERTAGSISKAIGESIDTALKDPMKTIAVSVQEASGQQTEAAGETLKTVLDKFISQMDSTVMGRQQNMVDTMQKAQDALQNMSSDISNLISQIRSVGLSTQEAVSEKTARSLEAMNNSQIQMQNQMLSFIGQIQSAVSSSQGQMSAGLESTVKQLEDSVNGILSNIGSSNSEVQAGITRVNSGLAKTLSTISSAGERYERAANTIAGALDKASAVVSSGSDLISNTSEAAHALTGATGRVEQASMALSHSLNHYHSIRGAVDELIGKQLKENDSRKEVLDQLITHQRGMRDLDLNATAYLEKVNDLLTQNFSAYSNGLVKTTDAIVTNLAQASAQLKSTIDDLQENLDELNVILEKNLTRH